VDVTLFERALKQRCSVFAFIVSALAGQFLIEGLALAAVVTLAAAATLNLFLNPQKLEKRGVIAFGDEDFPSRKGLLQSLLRGRGHDPWTDQTGGLK
jgi:hypothetical protein